MTASRNLKITLISLVVPYAFAFAYPSLSKGYNWNPEDLGPLVPNVMMPIGTRTDVVSSVSLLLFVVALGILAILPAEVSKCSSAGSRHRVTSYVVITFYQVVLFLDILRAYATDWWVYIWSALRVRPVGPSTWMERPFISGNHHLWLSGVALLLTLAVIYALDRSQIAPADS